MSNSFWIDAIGYLAQGLFSSRFIVQWIASEKARTVLAPTLFWKLSLLASLFLVIYSVLVMDITLLVGQFIGYYIYIRNLMLKESWNKWPLAFRSIISVLPFVAVILILSKAGFNWDDFSTKHENLLFFIWGFTGQFIFSSRFIFQWYSSEKKKEWSSFSFALFLPPKTEKNRLLSRNKKKNWAKANFAKEKATLSAYRYGFSLYEGPHNNF